MCTKISLCKLRLYAHKRDHVFILSASLQTDLFGSAHNLLDVSNLLQILMFSLGAVTFSKIGLVEKNRLSYKLWLVEVSTFT